MKLSCAGIVIPSLLALFLGGCGNEPDPKVGSSAYAATSNTGSFRSGEQAGEGGLTPEELAVESPAGDGPDGQSAQSQAENGASSGASETNPEATARAEWEEIEWDALIPADWRPDKILEEYNADGLEDDDPRAQALMERLQELWKRSPVVQDLDGKRVKMPGFIVPLDLDERKIREFLLVPYYGACIHVPPPPANQTVHVVTREGSGYPGELFDTVWVSGTLKVEAYSGDLADAGYRMDAQRVEPYE